MTLLSKTYVVGFLGCVAAFSAGARAPEGKGGLQGEAPHPTEKEHSAGTWTSGIKQFFGTSYESYDATNSYSDASSTAPVSKVWFTGAQGILTEVYWPRLDQAQVRDSQFLVSDGKSFLWEERVHSQSRVEWIRPGVPLFTVTTTDPEGRFSIEKRIFTDPSRNALLMHVKITKNIAGLQVYHLHNPSAGNDAFGNDGWVNNSDQPGLYAYKDGATQAVVYSVHLKKVSAGFVGKNDGYQDLARDYSMDHQYEGAHNGDVALMAELDLPVATGVSSFSIAIGFGSDAAVARATALNSLKGIEDAERLYVEQWESYQASLNDFSHASSDEGRLYRASLAVLKSSEDKTFAGAIVASPSLPWGLHRTEAVGYHMVWPRDLYQMATALMSAGDVATARACLNHLRRIQYRGGEEPWRRGSQTIERKGAFMQNGYVDGTPHWVQLQMDQTAYPLLLAYRLWKVGAIELKDYEYMVLDGARFIRRYGPWSSQERWEENKGISPSTAASEIAALWTSSEIMLELGYIDDSRAFAATADDWSSKPGDNLEAWTFTQTGGLGNGRYYERVEGAADDEQRWDPNDETRYYIGNTDGQSHPREKDVIDGGFLELVRLGVRDASDPHVLDTLEEYDRYIRVDTAKGPGFFRYLGDAYNYDDSSGRQTRGMLWPLLSGERAHYEMALAAESGKQKGSTDVSLPYLRALENFATPSLMIPEQVWDGGPAEGLPTGAATPLGWSHAEYVKLLASRSAGTVVDWIPAVANRARWLRHSQRP